MTASKISGRTYTRESIERALTHHKNAGNIGTWYRRDDGSYSVTITDFPPATLRTLREVHIFVLGLGSASKAANRRNASYFGIDAQVETKDGEYRGARQVPTFYLHESVQGIVSEEHAARIARDILTAAVGADSEFAAPIPPLHITATRL